MIVEFDVDVECGECGKTLSGSAIRSRYGNVAIAVEPCSNCLDCANSDGYLEGKEDAMAAADRADNSSPAS